MAKKAAAATKMTQSQIVAALAEQSDVSKKVAKGFLENLADMAVKQTKKSGVFIVPGIGRLVRSDRKARIGRNPATGEQIKIPAKKVVKFRVAKAAKVNLKLVTVEGIIVKNVEGMVMPKGAMRGTLLGMSFLRRLNGFRVEQGILYLEE